MENKSTLGNINRYTLLVGEGNFSFATDFITKTEHKVIATCLNSKDETMSELKLKNISFILDNGGVVLLDVDATELNNHRIVSKYNFESIIFNFPHIPGKMKIGENRKLLKNFFSSAKVILSPDGRIYVTLCKGQSGILIDDKLRKWNDSWQIVDLAAYSDLILSNIKPFNSKDYPSYQCSGFRGNDKPFNTEGAMTFVFRHGVPIDQDFVFAKIHENEFFPKHIHFSLESDLQKLNHIRNEKSHPINQTFCNIIEKAKATYHVLINDFIKYELFCLHHKQHALLCTPDILQFFHHNYCELSVMKTFVNNIIPKLEKEDAIFTNITCQSCYPTPNYFPYSCLYVLIFRKDCDEILLDLKFVLCSILDFKIEINDNIILDHLNIKTYDDELLNTLLEDSEIFCNRLDKYVKMQKHNYEQSGQRNCSTSYALQIFAIYDIEVIEGLAMYTNIKFKTMLENIHASSNAINIGSCHRILCKGNSYLYTKLDVASLAMIKYNVFNKQILYDKHAFYTELLCKSVYRPFALHSPQYIHDISFWIKKSFSEAKFLLLIKNTIGDFVFNVTKIDSYYDSNITEQSLCYRIIYYSLFQPLSKEKSITINKHFREIMEKFLDVKLR